MNITKTDVIWSYIAQFFGLCTNIITLPLILTHLSSDILAIWYVFFSVSTLVVMLDIGFQEAFVRNIAYVYGGASVLSKEGIIHNQDSITNGEIDYPLLKSLIITMRRFYGRIVFIILLFLLIPCTFYISYLSGDIPAYNNIILAWVIYAVSLAITFYCILYNAILQGKGYFKELNILKIGSKLIYLILLILGLLLGYGILAIAVANLIAIIIYSFVAPFFINKDKMFDILKKITKRDVNLLDIVGHNALKAGVSALVLSFTTRGSTMFFPLFIPSLDIVAQYGLSMQIIVLIWGTSLIYGQVHAPLLAQFRIHQNIQGLKQKFGEAFVVMITIFLIGALSTFLFGNLIFSYIGSNTLLLPALPLLFLFIIYFFDLNHTLAISFIASKNYIPYLKASIVTGIGIAFFMFFFTQVLDWGLYGFIFAIGVGQLLYHNWRWPLEITRDLQCNYKDILRLGITSLLTKKSKVNK